MDNQVLTNPIPRISDLQVINDLGHVLLAINCVMHSNTQFTLILN